MARCPEYKESHPMNAIDIVRARSVVIDERGQSTAEYALVLVAVVALGSLLISWVSKSGFFMSLFGKIGGLILSHL
jgi:hypothetical protein